PFKERTLTADGAAADYGQPLRWKLRQEHKVRVQLVTDEEVPQRFEQEFNVRYLPERPVVRDLDENPPGQVVTKPEFTLHAVVRPGLAGEEVSLFLYHRNEKTELKLEKGLMVRRPIQLQPGYNLLELVVVHKNALAKAEGLE